MELTELQEEWLQALESGNWKQGERTLGGDEDPTSGRPREFCCMGVGCELLVQRGAIKDYIPGQAYPEPKVVQAFGWRSTHGGNVAGSKLETGTNQLSVLNDNDGKNFLEIAAEVRANPERYFVAPETKEAA